MSTIAIHPLNPAAPGYFQRPMPVAVILGSFLALTLPLCVLSLTHPVFLERMYVKPIFLWLLGTTHFVITLTIYFQSANLQYFNSTWKNRVLYFLIPVGIFVGFDLYTALQVAVRWPAFDVVFRSAVRFLDNHHVTRQSYGVAQLFKRRSQLPFPTWQRRVESWYFWGLTLMLLLTFFSGGTFDVQNEAMLLGGVIVGAMFLLILIGYFQVWLRSRDLRVVAVPLTYLLLQSTSAGLAIYSTSLYIYCLTMHYVEYHVLMVPRCFSTSLDLGAATDRVYDRLRRNKALFYGLIVAVAALATSLTLMTMGIFMIRDLRSWPTPARLMIALFDGLFVMHYFIESLIWKFGNPYYRNSLLPLYFSPTPARVPVEARPVDAPPH